MLKHRSIFEVLIPRLYSRCALVYRPHINHWSRCDSWHAVCYYGVCHAGSSVVGACACACACLQLYVRVQCVRCVYDCVCVCACVQCACSV